MISDLITAISVFVIGICTLIQAFVEVSNLKKT